MNDANIVVLISGRGSNLSAILQSKMAGEVQAVISDNPRAAGLHIAESHDVATYVVSPSDFRSSHDWGAGLLELLTALSPRLVVLAGFMRVLPPSVVSAFAKKIINIHPSLLPHFRGLHPHRQALAAGATQHGCTVHWVSDVVDGGEIIAQESVQVFADDDEEKLAARVLAVEHTLYPKVLTNLLQTRAAG